MKIWLVAGDLFLHVGEERLGFDGEGQGKSFKERTTHLREEVTKSCVLETSRVVGEFCKWGGVSLGTRQIAVFHKVVITALCSSFPAVRHSCYIKHGEHGMKPQLQTLICGAQRKLSILFYFGGTVVCFYCLVGFLPVLEVDPALQGC